MTIWEAAFLANLAETRNVVTAAGSVGISRKTAYQHRQEDPDFAARWSAALSPVGEAGAVTEVTPDPDPYALALDARHALAAFLDAQGVAQPTQVAAEVFRDAAIRARGDVAAPPVNTTALMTLARTLGMEC